MDGTTNPRIVSRKFSTVFIIFLFAATCLAHEFKDYKNTIFLVSTILFCVVICFVAGLGWFGEGIEEKRLLKSDPRKNKSSFSKTSLLSGLIAFVLGVWAVHSEMHVPISHIIGFTTGTTVIASLAYSLGKAIRKKRNNSESSEDIGAE